MFRYHPLGDCAFLIKAGDGISVEIHQKIKSLADEIAKASIKGIVELVPAYNELMVIYKPGVIHYKDLLLQLKAAEKKTSVNRITKKRIIHIPVCYDQAFALDIDFVAKANEVTPEEVKNIHSGAEYLVYMLGFTPGFCYLGGMHEKIATPRKEIPRKLIEAGSVGIAGKQTGVYPIDSPGGWQIIGKTPLKLFDANRKPEFLIQAGDYIKFSSVNHQEFLIIQEKIRAGNYELVMEYKDV